MYKGSLTPFVRVSKKMKKLMFYAKYNLLGIMLCWKSKPKSRPDVTVCNCLQNEVDLIFFPIVDCDLTPFKKHFERKPNVAQPLTTCCLGHLPNGFPNFGGKMSSIRQSCHLLTFSKQDIRVPNLMKAFEWSGVYKPFCAYREIYKSSHNNAFDHMTKLPDLAYTEQVRVTVS